MSENHSTAIARRFSDDELRSITDLDSALALAQSHGPVNHVSDLIGDGFSLVKDKRMFLNVRMLVLSWTISKTDKYGDGGEMATVRVVTDTGKYVFNDGSTGIKDQLKSVPSEPFVCPRGLVVSEYTTQTTNAKTGEIEETPAETWYFNTSR